MPNKLKQILIILTGWVLSALLFAGEKNPVIQFKFGDSLVKELSVAELQKGVQAEPIEVFDVMYNKPKRYRAFPLADLLKYAYGDIYLGKGFGSLAFIASDGYKAVADRKLVSGESGYLVIGDLDIPDWEEIPKYDVKPGPFYLVWSKPGQTPKTGYPWPWQISTISLIRFEEQYANAVPKITDIEAPIMAGYQLFKKRCISCHAINRQGGSIGPDLDAPMNILSYRSESMLRSFIKSPSKYRYSSMPDFKDLTEQELDQLLEYFWYLNKRSRVRKQQ